MLLTVLVLTGAGCNKAGAPTTSSTPTTTATDSSTTSTAPAMSEPLKYPGTRPAAELSKKVRIKTTKGDIVIQIDPEAGPNAASNFLYLVEQGFYDGIIFHRVIPNFMIQGGDPTGTGFSGPGYTIPDDKVSLPRQTLPVNGGTITLSTYKKGLVAMARTGAPNSGGSQFFVMVDDSQLPPEYAVFGHVIEGQAVADAISQVERNSQDRPLQNITMTSVSIEN